MKLDNQSFTCKEKVACPHLPNDPVDRSAFKKDRTQYWKDRLKEMEGGK